MYRRYPGRPLKFRDPAALRAAVDAYFDGITIWQPIPGVDSSGKPRTRLQRVYTQPPTISGLALALDTDRSTLLKYCAGDPAWGANDPISDEVKQELTNTIRYAHARVEEYSHEALYIAKSAVGPVFSLKNNHPDWEDVSTVRTQHSVEQADLSRLSDDELKEYLRLKEKACQTIENASPVPVPAGLLIAEAGVQAAATQAAAAAKEEERVQQEQEQPGE